MAHNCGECTYLDTSTGDIYGKFYCERKYERHYSTDIECGSFCKAYSRDTSTIKNSYNYSNKHTSSGCYLTTILCNILKMPDNNYYLNTMRIFRKNTLQKNNEYKEILVEYDIIGPKIAKCINQDPLKYKLCAMYFYKFIKPITKLINENKTIEAINLYKEMTINLKTFYTLENETLTSIDINNADIKNSGHGQYIKKSLV